MSAADLVHCPIEVAGDWPEASPEAAKAVLERMRAVCLAGVDLRSDRQPAALRVENHHSGVPAIWLHNQPADAAWIMTSVGPRDWCKLAYQFGHELGHVLCNSWLSDAAPRPPCQWLEEALVEAFSIRGLGLLAESWKENPPFDGDQDFSNAIHDYQTQLITKDKDLAEQAGATNLRGWFKAERAELDKETGLGLEQAALPVMLGLIVPQPVLITDYGALNRWPERSELPLPEYLNRWRESCKQIGTANTLPSLVARLLSATDALQ